MYWVLCGIRAGSLQLEGNYWCILPGATLQPLFIALSTGTKTLPHKLNALNSPFENVLIQVMITAAVKYGCGLENRVVKV